MEDGGCAGCAVHMKELGRFCWGCFFMLNLPKSDRSKGLDTIDNDTVFCSSKG